MARRLVFLLVLAVALPSAAVGQSAVSSLTSAELRLTMDDGVSIAATLVEPAGAKHRIPAVLMLHGLAGNRGQLLPIAQRYAQAGYAVLAPDFRGHGESGGVTSIDGPRELKDVRALFAWLRARPEIDGAHIGAWGISLGGGAVLRALVEGIPFAAVETAQTWTDLYTALSPGGLPKTGAIFTLLNSVPAGRIAPEVTGLKEDAFAGRNLAAQRAFTRARSSRQLLSRVRTPLLMMQGRRDFIFDIAQAKAALRLVRGPHLLYVGDFGHAPSSFPGPDIAYVESLGVRWFDRYLRQSGPPIGDRVNVAPDPYHGTYSSYGHLPPTRGAHFVFTGTDTFAGAGKAQRTSAPTGAPLETFGAGSVSVTATLRGGWSRLVAVVTAKPPHRPTLLVTEGGLATAGLAGRHRLRIPLIDDATLIPRGSRLGLTLASSSLAQDPQNLLYLDLPMPPSSHARLGGAVLILPVLRERISH